VIKPIRTVRIYRGIPVYDPRIGRKFNVLAICSVKLLFAGYADLSDFATRCLQFSSSHRVADEMSKSLVADQMSKSLVIQSVELKLFHGHKELKVDANAEIEWCRCLELLHPVASILTWCCGSRWRFCWYIRACMRSYDSIRHDELRSVDGDATTTLVVVLVLLRESMSARYHGPLGDSVRFQLLFKNYSLNHGRGPVYPLMGPQPYAADASATEGWNHQVFH